MIRINLLSPCVDSSLPVYLLSDIGHVIDRSESLLCELPPPCSEFVTSQQFDNLQTEASGKTFSFPAELTPGLRIVRGQVSNRLSERVLDRLAEAERKATNGERDDLRIAYLTVLKCSDGILDAWRMAFLSYLGGEPSKLIPYFVARETAWRTPNFPPSLLPLRYTKYWREDFRKGMEIAQALPPKKQPKPITDLPDVAKEAKK